MKTWWRFDVTVVTDYFKAKFAFTLQIEKKTKFLSATVEYIQLLAFTIITIDRLNISAAIAQVLQTLIMAIAVV